MKHIVVLFFISSVSAFGQQNFQYEKSQVVWEKIFDTELSKEEIKEIMENDPWLSAIADDFEGDIGRFDVSCEKKQISLKFQTTIDFMDKRYKVKISHIHFAPSRADVLFGGVPYTAIVPIEPSQVDHRMAKELLDNEEAENSRKCLNTFFQEKFSFRKTSI